MENGSEIASLAIPAPQYTEVYYSSWVQIDNYNRCRQDDLDLEKKIETRRWGFRAGSLILNMVVVESWLLHNGARGLRRHMAHRASYEALVCERKTILTGRACGERSDGNVEPLLPAPTSGRGAYRTLTKRKRQGSSGGYAKASYLSSKLHFVHLQTKPPRVHLLRMCRVQRQTVFISVMQRMVDLIALKAY